jgi:nitrogen fixation/metabolism regulation signal transduction histidine kinase
MLLVDQNVQWAIVRQMLMHLLGQTLASVIFLALLQFLLGGLLKPWSEHWRTIWPLTAAVLVSLVVFLPKFIYDSFRLSQRFVGPVKKLRRSLRELAEGKPFSPLKFRKGDYWQEMAEELNRAVETLRKQRSAEEPSASERNVSSRLADLETVAK